MTIGLCKKDFGRVCSTLKRDRYFWKGCFTYRKSKLVKSQRIKINEIYTYLHTEYVKLYTTYTYKLPEFSSKIGFPRNVIFKSSIWVITLTDVSSNLKPFEIQNDSTTLFNQSFLYLDHKNV